MFFNISQKHQTNFSNFYQLGPFSVSTDAGWREYKNSRHHVVYKGYADNEPMDSVIESIIEQTEPNILGNFCALVFDSKTLKIKTDRYRSFPIWFESGQAITNLHKLTDTAWTDSLVEINTDLTVNETKFDVIGEIDTSNITVDQAVDQINHILKIKTQNFIKTIQRPVRAFLSGGVDSLLVYSYLQRYTDDYEMVQCNHIDYDEFWLKNSGTIQRFWGYTQIHHWRESCVLTSGTPGDEFMLRSPTTVDLYLRFHKKNMIDLLSQDQWKYCLHYNYFTLDKHQTIFSNHSALPDWNRSALIRNICNILVNDWQHWHIGNTLTWTPLRDLEIVKLLLRLPLDDLLGQIMNSDISRRLIEQNKPGLTNVISDQKNSGNSMKNLVDFYFKDLAKSAQ